MTAMMYLDDTLRDWYIRGILDKRISLQQPTEALQHAQPELDILVDDLLLKAPGLKGLLPSEELNSLRFALLQNIHGYGRTKRKLGKHYFANHPFRAAQLCVEAERWNRGPHDITGYIQGLDMSIHSILAHDRAEERVSKRLKKEKADLSREVLERMEEGEIITKVQAVILDLNVSVPPHERELPWYEKEVLELLHGPKSSRHFRRAGITRTTLQEYFAAISDYVPTLRRCVIKREEELLTEEFSKYEAELLHGLEAFFPAALAREMTAGIIDTVRDMTRIGSELYYTAIGRLFSGASLRAQVAKYSDRLANTLDMDHTGPLTATNLVGGHVFYNFSYDPLAPKPNLEIFSSGIYTRKRLRTIAEAFLARKENRNLNALLNISPKEARSKGCQVIDEVIIGITTANNRAARAERQREYRAEIKDRLRPQEKLWELFKNIILETHARRMYGGNPPPILRYLSGRLMLTTLTEASHLVSETFSNHCLHQGELTLADARATYHAYQAYEAAGGLEAVTASSDGNGISFDGIFERYFDQRVQGWKRPLAMLAGHKGKFFQALIAIHGLAQRYYQDPGFYVRGVDGTGLHPVDPIGLGKVNSNGSGNDQ